MIKLSPRLLSVARLVKAGSRVADIGTDHGFLPVWLVQNGVCDRVVAMDINEKPLDSCRELVASQKLEEKIETRISDGLSSLCRGECDTVVIAGMGGELIADILSNCSFLNELHLVLQPMTHPEIVRKFLFDSAFEIKNDMIVFDSGHYYSVFDALFTSEHIAKTQRDYYLGNINDLSQKEYFVHLLNYLENKSKSGLNFDEIIAAIKDILNQ